MVCVVGCCVFGSCALCMTDKFHVLFPVSVVCPSDRKSTLEAYCVCGCVCSVECVGVFGSLGG